MPTLPQQTIEPPGRWLAHHIIDGERDHGFAVVTLADDGSVTIEPFRGETHSTSFHSGTITILRKPTRLVLS